MRKYVIGLIVGVAVTAYSSVYASDIQSLVGRLIEGQFPVKVAGKQLNDKAIVVNGTSYLPVRAIGEALHMDVSWNDEMVIELKEKCAE